MAHQRDEAVGLPTNFGSKHSLLDDRRGTRKTLRKSPNALPQGEWSRNSCNLFSLLLALASSWYKNIHEPHLFLHLCRKFSANFDHRKKERTNFVIYLTGCFVFSSPLIVLISLPTKRDAENSLIVAAIFYFILCFSLSFSLLLWPFPRSLARSIELLRKLDGDRKEKFPEWQHFWSNAQLGRITTNDLKLFLFSFMHACKMLTL